MADFDGILSDACLVFPVCCCLCGFLGVACVVSQGVGTAACGVATRH